MIAGSSGRPAGGGVDDRGHHHVDGDDVDRALGHAGELLQQAAGVADDDRLGHAEAADPAGPGLGPGRLDDRRPHDRHRDVAPLLEQRPLAEGLGVGVGVGPAERAGPGPAGLDHALLDPRLAALLGLGRQRRGAGGAELARGPPSGSGPATRACGSGPRRPAGRGGRRRPRPASRRRRRTGSRAPAPRGPRPGGCRRRSRSTRRRGGASTPRSWSVADDAAGPEQVDLDRGVERRVEGDGGGRVDDDVARRERGAPGVVEAEAVGADVAGDDRDPPVDHRSRTPSLPSSARSRSKASLRKISRLARWGDGRPLAGPDEQHQLAAGHRPQQPLDERGAEEAGAAGDGDALAVESLGDHRRLSTIW